MTTPTMNDVLAVDPVLTNLLVGYMQADSRFVADRVFPAVSVEKADGTFYKMTKKYWFADEMKVRAPGSPFPEGDYGLETDTFATLQYALSKAIADEVRANNQAPMDLETATVRWLSQQMLIRKERAFASDFMAASVWGTTDNNSATDWDDFEAGDPVANIATGKQTISVNTGYEPRHLVCGLVVYDALKQHPDIIDRIKYTTAATAAAVQAAVAAVLDLDEIIVGRASYNSANEAQTASYAAVIDDDALLCYVDRAAGIMGATAGKTFAWAPGGGAGSILPVVRDNINHRDLVQAWMQWDQKATATDLGYIWLDIV
jgi:hypothetical protein